MSEEKELLEKSVEIARKKGAKEVVVKLIRKKEYQIRFSNSAIDISKQWTTNLLEVFLSIGRKTSFIKIQNPSIDLINEKISHEILSLRKLPKSLLYWGIDKSQYEYRFIEGLHDSRIEKFSDKAPDFVNMAINSSLESGAKKVAGVLYFGNISTGVSTSYNNGGIYNSSYYRMTVRAFVDAESSGQDIIVGRNLEDIENKFTEAGKRAGELAKMAVGGEQGKPGKYDLIMSPTVAANVFNHIYVGANPLQIILKMSCLSKIKIGQQVAPEYLTISDNALIPEGLNSRPFDIEGTPSQSTPIIKDGKFAGLIHNTSSAKLWRLMNLIKMKWIKSKTTANSYLGSVLDEEIGPKLLAPLPSNFVYEKGDYSLNEIISESKNPTIYLTSNWYTRFTNYLEGKFSTIPRDGIFLIENGEIRKPIRKLRLTETLLGMLSRIKAIGKDIKQIKWWEVETPTFIPTIKVGECNFTAATE
ncbi:MAG: TldD/PmbA family protein [Promethearchaeota archaeon]